ncbi:hypothetical protein BJ322DRAFT_888718 [Thelephora terrestris]|uniref:Nephrocystin 3-like N-terminal domain-containing protein n=1 Tax=Thelephora terrestris TaxID=56493 RepID=A0A9P6L5B4_9AGAM|nr:hypothetical protein BJ322DRAFT_888718 [Thelephora terrestris]
MSQYYLAREAQYQPGDKRVCREGTREGLLFGIELWAQDRNGPPICWLTGPHRSGKSTIARTIAEKMTKNGSLGASFFCTGRFSFKAPSDTFVIVPTLAFQLAQNYSKFRSSLKVQPAYPSLEAQVNNMIVRPLKESAISTLIIIDALDACEDEERMVSLLGRLASEAPKVKFFITSRPEPGIRSSLDGWKVPVFYLDCES